MKGLSAVGYTLMWIFFFNYFIVFNLNAVCNYIVNLAIILVPLPISWSIRIMVNPA